MGFYRTVKTFKVVSFVLFYLLIGCQLVLPVEAKIGKWYYLLTLLRLLVIKLLHAWLITTTNHKLKSKLGFDV